MHRGTHYLISAAICLSPLAARADCPDPPTANLLTCWDFQGSDDNERLTDKSGNLHELSAFGGAVLVDGALTLDGLVDSRVELAVGSPQDLGGMAAATISLWFRPREKAKQALVWNEDFWDGYGIRITHLGQVDFSTSGGGIDEANQYAVDVWNHFTVTFDGSAGTCSFYVNGRIVGSSTECPLGTLPTATGQFYIGKESGSQTWFEGDVDDVQIYDRALAANEVRNLYTEGGPYDLYELSYADPGVGMTLINPPSSPASVVQTRDIAISFAAVGEASWYRVDRFVDSNPVGKKFFVEDDEYYTDGLWFHTTEIVTSLLADQGGEDSEPLVGSVFLGVSAWTDKPANGGVPVAVSDIIEFPYDHSFADLEFDVHVCDMDSVSVPCTSYAGELGPGEAVLVADPGGDPLDEQSELYAWVISITEDGGQTFKNYPESTSVPEYRVAFGQPGTKYIRFDGARNGTVSSLPLRGIRSGRETKVTHLILKETGAPDPDPNNDDNVNQHVLTSTVPTDLQFALTRKDITVFDGGSVFLPLDGANPDCAELDLPC